MSTLADRQTAFMRAILDEGAPLPDGWGERHAAGMGVYRGNYRGSLMAALEAAFERTRRYVGEAAFKRAGAHHLIANPPSGWTIDDAGAGFAETCAELFGDNPEVAQLAWLEWAMQHAATAPDRAPISAQDFAQASAGFDDADWMDLRLTLQPRLAVRVVEHDLRELWNALAEGGQAVPEPRFAQPMACIVWREGERPTFVMDTVDNAHALTAMQGGASYGEVIALLAGDEADDAAVQAAAMRAGQMLGLWLSEGMIAALGA